MPIREKDNFLVFGSPKIEEDEILEIEAVMRSGWLGTGPRVAQFEHDFGVYRGAAHAVALNSCSAALHLSLLASGVGPGDEVITTPLTFCATANAIIHTGATPVLADIDPDTLNIDPVQVRAKLSKRTRAIVPVHFAGRPCRWRGSMSSRSSRTARTPSKRSTTARTSARSATSAAHRSILDELLGLDMAIEHADRVELNAAAFVPAKDLKSMLAFLGDNARDHLLAGVANTVGAEPPLLERSVFAAGIPLDDCERIHQLVRERWGALHSELTREMT